jgi:hypothetical protein
MRVLEEIFAEVVDKNARVANHGKILDAQGKVVKDYRDVGLPAYLEFEVPAGTPYFTLEVNGARIHQPLSDTATVPSSQGAGAPLTPANAPVAAQKPPIAQPVLDAQPVDDALPVGDDADAWRNLPLEFGTDEKKSEDIDLDKK